MATLTVYDRSGGKVGEVEVDPAEFAPRINRQLLHDAVVMYQSNQRMGTAASKSRAQVAGTTKKLYRQKGTGNARAGSRRTNVRRGGGHAFAKRTRDWTYRMPRKALQLATRMAIAAKIQDGQVALIDELAFDVPSTKSMVGVLQALSLCGQTLLISTDGYDVQVYKSARNIPGVDVAPVSDLNALSVLKPTQVLMTKSAFESLRSRVAGAAESVGAA
ncbi:MAG: 50S ribosomal protein L4 [Pirellulales bacterium]|nr:50S ribosomal protein L4 [Pirellulales bacterium]